MRRRGVELSVLGDNSTMDSSNEALQYTPSTSSLPGGTIGSVQDLGAVQKIVVEICSSTTFWRFTAFSLLLINLNAVFRHLDATLPTYLLRCFGTRVPKGTIYSINPFIIIFLAPVVSAWTSKYAHFDMIKYGGFITAVSPFFLAISTSIWLVLLCYYTLLYLLRTFPFSSKLRITNKLYWRYLVSTELLLS